MGAHQLEPESTAYNLRTAYRFEGRLDVSALTSALGEVVRRHEVLRTSFVEENGSPIQLIAEPRPIELPLVDLSELSGAVVEAELRRLIEERLGHRFDLTEPSLLEPTLFRLATAEHVLLLVMHHIVFDGWSGAVLLEELLTLYEAAVAGGATDLLPPSLQYAEFAAWQREQLGGEALERQLDHWRQRLAGAPMVLELPRDGSRSASREAAGGLERAELDDELKAAVRELSLAEGATVFMAMLAAFGVLLERYSGQDEILVGTPIANRNRAELERLIGFFVNTLVLRLDLRGDPTFRELLGRVRDTALDAYEHQDLPFEKLVESLRPPRDLDRTPLFQVLFLFQNTPMPTFERAGLVVTHMEVPFGTARFDLTLSVFDGARLRADYKTDLFEQETVAGMLRHYRRLLAAAVVAPDRPISELSLLSADEGNRVDRWNPAPREHAEVRLEHLFEQRVERAPGAPALLVSGRPTVTFERLNAWANRIAARLERVAIEAEEPIGVCLERSPALVAALLGVLKAGGAWVPLDPEAPEARTRLLVEETRMPAVLAGSAAPRWLSELGPALLTVDEDPPGDGAAVGDPGPPARSAETGDVAYVLYTSGSTGRPKGVAGRHRGSVNRLRWMWREFPFMAGEICCQKTAPGFVDSVWEVFGPLLQGVPSLVLEDDEVRDPRVLIERLAGAHVTRIVLVPSLLRAMLDVGADELGSMLPDLRIWVSSGEALPASLAARWRRAMGDDRVLLNLYGSTEVAGDSLWHEVKASDRGTVPLGEPIDNTRAYVLDDRMEPLPTGVPGDLWIGGVGLARGYLGRPGQTASSFVPDPFSRGSDGSGGRRLYRTGDRARRRSDGAILFDGRGDLQIKLRGYRIELGEVETVLGEHPKVAAAAAAVAGEEPDRRVVAYWVAAEAVRAERAEHADGIGGQLRAWLATRLPAYMVPAELIELPRLPLTASGKIDHGALPEPASGPERRWGSGAGFVAPRDELELQLAHLWEELLPVDRVGVRDDFFELGGHSLKAVELLSRIEVLTGRRLPLAGLVRAATVESLATSLRDRGWSPSWTSLVPIRPAGSKRPFFCVPGAGGHLLFYRELGRHLDPERPFYGLQARGLDDQQEAVADVEEMARHYIDEIRAVQASGPYLIGGSCFGGSVAYEMARRLVGEGEIVLRLILLEAYAPLTGPVPTELRTRVATWLRRRRLGRARLLGSAWRRARQRLRGKPARPVTGSLERAVDEVILASMRARRNYRPEAYRGSVTVFQGSERPGGYTYPELMGWPTLVRGAIDLETVPGFHTGVFRDPAVRELGARLSAVLDQQE